MSSILTELSRASAPVNTPESDDDRRRLTVLVDRKTGTPQKRRTLILRGADYWGQVMTTC
jgi:hypothetical protein